MIKEAIGCGSTIEAAKEEAISKLNASEFDDIQYEIIKMPKKKILGLFGGCDAQVRAFIEVEEKKSKANKKPAMKKENNLKKEVKETKAVKNEKPAPQKPAEEKVQKPVEEKAQKSADSEYGEPVNESEPPADSQAGKAIAYVRTVLEALDCKDLTVKAAFKENGARIMLEGEDISVIIGRRGETLDSLQYLASLAANNGGGHYRISINIGNYRERREETLINLAKRISAQVVKTGKTRSLEPMNPYERRIIHTAIQGIDGVYSASFGEGNTRRVVIAPEGAEIKPPRYSNDRRNNGRRGGRQGGRRTSNQVVADPNREPKKDSDIPLYGKIN